MKHHPLQLPIDWKFLYANLKVYRFFFLSFFLTVLSGGVLAEGWKRAVSGTEELSAFGDVGLMLTSSNKYCSRRNCADSWGCGSGGRVLA